MSLRLACASWLEGSRPVYGVRGPKDAHAAGIRMPGRRDKSRWQRLRGHLKRNSAVSSSGKSRSCYPSDSAAPRRAAVFSHVAVFPGDVGSSAVGPRKQASAWLSNHLVTGALCVLGKTEPPPVARALFDAAPRRRSAARSIVDDYTARR